MTSGSPQPQPQPTPTSFAIATVSEDEDRLDRQTLTTINNPQPTPTTTTTSSPTNSLQLRNSFTNTNASSSSYATPLAVNTHSSNTNINHNALVLLSNTPVEEAVKLDGAEFEHIMKERTRMRREKEDTQIAELRVKVTRLELALAAETKRRVEATKMLEQETQDQIIQLEQRCLQEIQTHQQLVDTRLNKLESRLEVLEQRLEEEHQQQLDQVSSKGKEFTTALQELRQEAETERKLRLVREGQFLQQIEAHGKNYEELWSAEKQERIEAVHDLVHVMESNEKARLEQRKHVEVRLEQELAQLQDALELEALERKRRDDDIAAELNRCTVMFQQHLAILTEDD